MYLTFNSVKKFRQIYAKENEEKAQAEAAAFVRVNDSAVSNSPADGGKGESGDVFRAQADTADRECEEENSAEKAVYVALLEAEKTHFQWAKQAKNFFVFLCLAFVDLWRGSKHHPSLFGVEVCSPEDWASIAIFMTICGGLTAWNVRVE